MLPRDQHPANDELREQIARDATDLARRLVDAEREALTQTLAGMADLGCVEASTVLGSLSASKAINVDQEGKVRGRPASSSASAGWTTCPADGVPQPVRGGRFFLNEIRAGAGTILGSAMPSLGADAPKSPRGSILGGTGPISTARGQIGLSFPFADVTDFDRELIVD